MHLKSSFALLFTVLFVCACTSQRLTPPENLSSVEHLANQNQLEHILADEVVKFSKVKALKSKSLFGSNDLSKIDSIAAVLLATENVSLLPDEEFYRVFNIVGNHQSDVLNSFALALSSFITRHDYHCVRPVYAQYFITRYGLKASATECKNNLPIHLTSTLTTQNKLNIDADRVSAIHILFAGSGEGIVSTFGHISLRLIVCPENDYSEQACNSNLFEHIVLGFRAHVDEFNLDPFQGLFGGYNSYLFAHDFIDTYQEYAIGEFREIYSLPLKMTKAQRKLLLRNLIDIHWSFSGNYKFLTNNCSILMQTALLNSWPELSNDPELTELYWRPDNFFKALTSSKLTKSSKLSDLEVAEQQGFYFSSTLPIYQQAMESINSYLKESNYDDIESYLNSEPIIRFENANKDSLYQATLKKNKKLLSAQILLEELSVVRTQRWLSVELAAYFAKNDIKSINKHMQNILNEQEIVTYQQCLLLPVLASIKAIKLKDGIPENVIKDDDYNFCHSAQEKLNLKQVRLQLKNFDPKQWRLVERAYRYWRDSVKNVDTYIRMESM
ncbi:DUF4105 domain-containing protein [Thalassotalea fonticola]|uniref:DUF4105 domain-containing protein n=1 Tax=Thalassotalea fonticola TaxID=3065649 RepID=A0ABZ0GNP7_9GAMM|nr:DUF4105 domain-containing protein [Colwelliaceae bacterium S1-1]